MKHCERAKEVVTDHGRNGHFTVQFDSKLYKIRARHLDYPVQILKTFYHCPTINFISNYPIVPYNRVLTNIFFRPIMIFVNILLVYL